MIAFCHFGRTFFGGNVSLDLRSHSQSLSLSLSLSLSDGFGRGKGDQDGGGVSTVVQNWRSLQVTKLQRRVFFFVAVPHAILNRGGSGGGRGEKTFEIQKI
jgi:hypothetical protein